MPASMTPDTLADAQWVLYPLRAIITRTCWRLQRHCKLYYPLSERCDPCRLLVYLCWRTLHDNLFPQVFIGQSCVCVCGPRDISPRCDNTIGRDHCCRRGQLSTPRTPSSIATLKISSDKGTEQYRFVAGHAHRTQYWTSRDALFSAIFVLACI